MRRASRLNFRLGRLDFSSGRIPQVTSLAVVDPSTSCRGKCSTIRRGDLLDDAQSFTHAKFPQDATVVEPATTLNWFRVRSRSFAAVAARTKGGPAAKGKGAEAAEQRGRKETLIDACLQGQPVYQEAVSESELLEAAAKAKEYSRLSMAEHRQMQALESARLKLKLAAIDALPPGKLRDAAQKPDYSPFPKKLQAPSLTPPVEQDIEDTLAAQAKPVRKLR